MLIGYHFPKTGGTAILAHLRRHLGDEAVFVYGPHANLQRLKTGEPLLEELPPERLATLRAVVGHGVDARTVGLFAHRDPVTFAVCREPGARFVSAYKHALRHASPPPASARENLLTREPSPFLIEIRRRFGGPRGLAHILRHEHLREDSAPLFAALGVPPLDVWRRVHPEPVDLGDLDLAEVRARDADDAALHARLPLVGATVAAPPLSPEQACLHGFAHAVTLHQGLALRAMIEARGSPLARSLLSRFPEVDADHPQEQAALARARQNLKQWARRLSRPGAAARGPAGGDRAPRPAR